MTGLDVPLQTAPQPGLDQDEAERRQITVMFCDLVGSTALSHELDPEELRQVVRGYQEACVKVITELGGHVAQYLGDGVMVYFGYPVAHENDAQRAVRAALQIVAAVRQMRTPSGHALKVRIGIHTGLVVVGDVGAGRRRERLALGETPNIAARLEAAASPDDVLISEQTARLVQGMFEWTALGPLQLKGLAQGVPAYRVTAETSALSRFEASGRIGLTALVGRDAELKLLSRQLDRAEAAQGQVVLVYGEPGIGKSRLVQTFLQRHGHDSYERIEWHCSPFYQNTAFYPVVGYLQRRLEFDAQPAADGRLSILEGALQRRGMDSTRTLPLFAALLGLSLPRHLQPVTLTPQRQRRETVEAILEWLLFGSQRECLCLTVEDLHWIDASTTELLDALVERVANRRVLALLTHRPGFNSTWTRHAHVTAIGLERLRAEDVRAMVAEVAGHRHMPSEIVEQVATRTDGVPLFVEELTKTLLESGLMQLTKTGYEVALPLPSLAIPATLKDSLMARLDRLANVREVAQLAAALGREFSYRLLRAVCPLSDALLQADLARLVQAELLYQQGVPPDARFMFKHALLQEETYESLLRSKRQQVHQRIATVLESEFAEIGSAQPELIAYHYTNAMRHLAAIPYWQRAGQSAMERSANVEAVAHLSKGLECLVQVADSPERRQMELALQISLAVALMATRGWAAPEVGRAAARARELSDQVGDSPQLLPVLWGLWVFSVVRADFSTSEALATQYRRITNACKISDQVSRLQEHFMAGDALFWQGRFESARRELEQGDALENAFARREQANIVGWDCGVSCLMHASWSIWILGYPDRAAVLNRDMLELAKEISHPSTTLWSLWGAGVLHQLRREVQPALSSADAMIQLATELVFPHWAGLGTALKGWALGSLGAAERGMPMARHGMNTWRATAGETITCFCLSMLADLQIAHGCEKEGIDGLDEMISSIERTSERWLETELYRLKGEALLAQSPDRRREAEACFQHAIEVARAQAAKSFELRATVSLARLWGEERRGEASRMLSSIYRWFKEGFNTADLQGARALLEGLR